MTLLDDETTPLAPNRDNYGDEQSFPGSVPERHRRVSVKVIPEQYISRVLPLALSASVGMAATAATTVYAYAVIMCADPSHCRDAEQRSYAGAVAVAAAIANVCGILTLGPLQDAIKLNPKAGLFFWLTSRATSVAVLAVAVIFKSMPLAFLGRIFEGFATDNLLHYSLSAVYVSASDKSRFPRLMGTSLALFMLGMSVSATVAGMLPSFFTSFIMALSVFAASGAYLAVFVPVVSGRIPRDGVLAGDTGNLTQGFFGKQRRLVGRRLASLTRPLADLFLRDRRVILPAVALLLYNTTQSYLFPALMVYTALNFSFTGKQNGYLLSISATVSALYLLTVFYVLPRIRKRLGKQKVTDGSGDSEHSSRHEFICAVLSMSTQLVALPSLYLATEVWQVYPLVGVMALGLAAPSFIKSYGVSLSDDKSAAVASLAMMESLGGLLSAVVLGWWQSKAGPGAVFLVAAGLVGSALLSLFASQLVRPLHSGGR